MAARQTNFQSLTDRAKQDSRQPAEHPFRIGETYANRQGKYEVVDIAPPTMTVRYEAGGVMRADIAILARIWENLQMPPEQPEAGPRTRAAAKPASAARALRTEFRGLLAEDFKSTISRTTWRVRLGQLLATRLSELTLIPHKSFPVENRPELYITREHHYNGKLPEHRARFLFRLTSEAAEYGFLVERDAQKMDRTWDWLRFVDALREPGPWAEQVTAAMRTQGLQAAADSAPRRAGDTTTAPARVGAWTAAAGGLESQLADGNAPAPCTWQDMAGSLNAVELGLSCEFHILGHTAKDEAIALGERIVERAAQAYAALMPLYEASARLTGVR